MVGAGNAALSTPSSCPHTAYTLLGELVRDYDKVIHITRKDYTRYEFEERRMTGKELGRNTGVGQDPSKEILHPITKLRAVLQISQLDH